MKSIKNLVCVKHPLVESYVTKIRDVKTPYSTFRSYVDKLSFLLAYEASRELSTRNLKINTPLEAFNGTEIYEEIILVPILRAGLGLMPGFCSVFPEAKVSHIGIYRDEETLKPVRYYFRFPSLKNKKNAAVFILDPMLATGGSINYTIQELKKHDMKKIIVASLVSAPEGINAVMKANKNVKIYTCALDKKLNKHGYIVPGLGDAGDRMFGT